MKYYIYFIIIFVVLLFSVGIYKNVKTYMQPNLEIDKSKYTPSDITSIIPLDIYQTWHTKKLPKYMKRNVEKLKNDNPEFNIHVYDIDDCRTFIINNFDNDVLYAYDKLIPLSYKSDLWRYCILYKKGGIYLDIKFKCAAGFKFIELVDKEYFVLDRQFQKIGMFNYKKNELVQINNKIYNLDNISLNNELNLINNNIYYSSYIKEYGNPVILTGLQICKKNNPVMLECINQIIKNVKNNYYGDTCIDPTGPVLLGKCYFKLYKYNFNNFSLFFSINGMYILNKTKIILDSYPEYRNEQKKSSNIPYYCELWNNKNIYN